MKRSSQGVSSLSKFYTITFSGWHVAHGGKRKPLFSHALDLIMVVQDFKRDCATVVGSCGIDQRWILARLVSKRTLWYSWIGWGRSMVEIGQPSWWLSDAITVGSRDEINGGDLMH